MFGYIRYDLPNLFIKDFMLYKALYCGLCKGIGVSCGQRARLGLTYDVTFLSALLHNMMGIDVKIERKNCFEHAIRKRPIAAADDLTQELGALNTALAYQKAADDNEPCKKPIILIIGFFYDQLLFSTTIFIFLATSTWTRIVSSYAFFMN